MARALRKVPSDFYWSTPLLNSPHNNDNPQRITARQAAEALFTPKQEHHATPSEPESAIERKPRILGVPPVVRATSTTRPRMASIRELAPLRHRHHEPAPPSRAASDCPRIRC